MILVTGGTGLLGAHLLLSLTVNGEKVRALKRENSDISKTEKIFSYYSHDFKNLMNKIEWITGDLLDIYSLKDAMKDIDDVYHCAAMVTFTSNNKTLINKVNVEGTANIVNIALAEKIKKFCFVSSIGAITHKNSLGIFDEKLEFNSDLKLSHYSLSKLNAEREVWRGIHEGLNAFIINPSVIIGPGDWKNDSSRIIGLATNGMKHYTKGVTGYVDVRDVVNIMISLMKSDIIGERFIANSQNIDYFNFYSLIAKYLNNKPPSVFAGSIKLELAWCFAKMISILSGKPPIISKDIIRISQKKTQYSNNKIRERLNYNFIPLEESIKFCCEKFTNKS